jgi:hypothetical protein
MLTVLAAALLVAGPAFGKDDARGWVVVNGHADFDARVRNQRAVLDLLRNGVPVYWMTSVGSTDVGFADGDFAIPLCGDTAYVKATLDELPTEQVKPLPAAGGLKGYRLRFPRLAVYGRGGSYFFWYVTTLRQGGFRICPFNGKTAADLKGFDVFISPGGGGRITSEYNAMLTGFLKAGGHYVGSCYGAAQALYPSKVSYATGEVGASLIEADNAEIVGSYGALGGRGGIRVANRMPGHPVMWNLPAEFRDNYENGPVMKLHGETTNATILATLVSADFGDGRKDTVEEYGKAIWMAGQRPGEGRVVIFGDHPETPAWKDTSGAQACWNAVLWCVAGPLEEISAAGNPAAEAPAWFRPGPGSPADVSARIAELTGQLEKTRLKPESRDVYDRAKVQGEDHAVILAAFARMKMEKGGDAAGRFALERDRLLNDLGAALAGYAERDDRTGIKLMELAIRFGEWDRDYVRFQRAAFK